jgi:hypothetical protein
MILGRPVIGTAGRVEWSGTGPLKLIKPEERRHPTEVKLTFRTVGVPGVATISAVYVDTRGDPPVILAECQVKIQIKLPPPPPPPGEVRITKILRILPDGQHLQLVPGDPPFGLDIDAGLLVEIRNSTRENAFAIFENESGPRFKFIRSPPVVRHRPLAPALAAVAMPATVSLPLPSPGLLSPISVPLPPRTDTTVEFQVTVAPLAPDEEPITDDVLVACAQREPLRRCIERRKRTKWRRLALRLAADYTGGDLVSGVPRLNTDPGGVIRDDKWHTYLPGSDARHSSVGTPIDVVPPPPRPGEIVLPVVRPVRLRPQELGLRAVLVLVDEKKKANPEIVTSAQLLQGYSAELTWKLTEISRHPGIASNWGSRDDRRQDLSFDDRVDLPDSRPGVVNVLPVFTRRLFVKDYAAAGRVHARMRILREDRATPHTTKTTDRPLPTDEDRDSLPDFWEREIVRDKTLSARTDRDEDFFFRSTRKGDGLSAHEEYRGFFVMRQHRRTDEMLDETPLPGGGTVGAANRGGPRRKDMFVEDSDPFIPAAQLFIEPLGRHPIDPLKPQKRLQLFRQFGSLCPQYGVSTHLIRPGESVLSQDKDVRIMNDAITRNTDPAFIAEGFPVPDPPLPEPVQFRIQYVNGPAPGGGYGESGAVFFRTSAPITIDHTKLAADLRNKFLLDGKAADHVRSIAVAHELGHRFTLRHPSARVAVTRVLSTPDDPLGPGEAAALLPDGAGLRFRTVVDDVSSTGTKSPLRDPVLIQFADRGAGLGDLSLIFDEPDYALPRDVASVQPMNGATVQNQPVLITERTVDFPFLDVVSRRPLNVPEYADAVTRRTATATVVVLLDLLGPRPSRSTDLMATGGGSFLFPAVGVGPARLRVLDMWRVRPADPALQE